jgi:polar amino acid transport system substrate-binding protein
MLERFLRVAGRLVPVLLLLIGCGSPSSANAPSSKGLRLGSTPWVPFTAEQGQPRVAAYLVERALERAGYEAHTTIVPDGTLTQALMDGRFDGSAALWPSPDREAFLLYSQPYMENRLVLVGRKGSDVSAQSFADLKGKRIALVEGYAYGPELDNAKDPIFVQAPSSQESIRAVLAGSADYCLLDALLVEFLFEEHAREAPQKLEVGGAPLIRRNLHFAVRKALPNAQKIIDGFNDVLGSMVRDGTYNLALQVSWISVDVDGDGKLDMVRQGNEVGAAPPTHSYRLYQGSTEGSPNTTVAPAVMTQQEQTRYYVNGRAYNSWEEIPESLKLQPGANQPGGTGHPQVKLIEW